MPRRSESLYEQVVQITHTYLGPAADRFIARQLENHLHKSPNELSQADLRSLIDWIRVVVSLLTEDGDIVEAYTTQLAQLAKSQSASATKKHKDKRHG